MDMFPGCLCKKCFLAPPVKRVRRSLDNESVKTMVHTLLYLVLQLQLALVSGLCTEDSYRSIAASTECCSTLDLQYQQVWTWIVICHSFFAITGHALAGQVDMPQQVQYELAVTVYRCLQYQVPTYLVELCVPVFNVAGRRHLWTTDCSTHLSQHIRHSCLCFCWSHSGTVWIHCLTSDHVLASSNSGTRAVPTSLEQVWKTTFRFSRLTLCNQCSRDVLRISPI